MDALSLPRISNSILNPAVPAPAADDPLKIRDAAQQFESLLLAQILRAERSSGHGWLNSGDDSAGEGAMDFAEQQLAGLLARQGGLGLASLIASGLEERSSPPPPASPGPPSLESSSETPPAMD